MSLGPRPCGSSWRAPGPCVMPEFSLTPENAEPIARICARLGGLPLTVDPAVARVALL